MEEKQEKVTISERENVVTIMRKATRVDYYVYDIKKIVNLKFLFGHNWLGCNRIKIDICMYLD